MNDIDYEQITPLDIDQMLQHIDSLLSIICVFAFLLFLAGFWIIKLSREVNYLDGIIDIRGEK